MGEPFPALAERDSAVTKGCHSQQQPHLRAGPQVGNNPLSQTCKPSTEGRPERENRLPGTYQQLPQAWSQSRAGLLFELGGCCPFKALFTAPS